MFAMEDPTPPPALPSEVSSDQKLWAVLCHVSLLLGVGFLLPLVVYLVKKEEDPRIAEHAREALNFHISVYIYGFVSVLLCTVLIGFILVPVVGVASVVFAIIAAIRASEGTLYHYPLTIRLI